MLVFSVILAIKMIYGICKEETTSSNQVGNAYFGENNISEMYMNMKKNTEVEIC
jgi:hypothetical protein